VSQTAVEKILSQHVGQPVRPDELVIVPVDSIMASDATAPYAIRAFEEMGGGDLWRPDKVILVIDHAAPAPNQRIGNLHRMMRESREQPADRLKSQTLNHKSQTNFKVLNSKPLSAGSRSV